MKASLVMFYCMRCMISEGYASFVGSAFFSSVDAFVLLIIYVAKYIIITDTNLLMKALLTHSCLRFCFMFHCSFSISIAIVLVVAGMLYFYQDLVYDMVN